MPDLAPLGLDIDSTKTVEAVQNLNKMAESAVKAEGASKQLEDATKAVGQAMSGNVTIVQHFNNTVNNYASAQNQAAKAMKDASDAASASGAAVTAHGRVVSEAEKIVRSHTSAVNDNVTAIGRLNNALSVQTRIDAMFKTGSPARDRAADIAAYGEALDRLSAKYNPVFAAEKKLNDTLAEIAHAQSVGAIDHTVAAAAIAKAREEFLGLGKEVAHTSENIGLNRLQMMELTHVARSLFDEIAAGQSPMRALALEAGRIQTFFQLGEGSIGQQFGGIASVVSKILNPLALVTAATVGLGVAATVAFTSFQRGQDDLAKSLNGLGQRTGNTVSDLNRYAYSGAARGGISNAQGVAYAADYAAVGIGGLTNANLIADTRAYGRITGADDPSKELAKLFQDPAKGAEELNNRLGLLDGRLEETIRNYEAQGNLDAARAALEQRLHDSLADATDTTWTFSKALHSATDGVSNFLHAAGNRIAGVFGLDDDATRLATDKRTRDNLSAADPVGNRTEIEDLQKEIDLLQANVDHQQSAAEQRKSDADARQQSLRADDIVRAVLPEIARQQNTENNIAVLRAALSDSNILDRMGAKPGDVQRAYGNLAIQSANDSPQLRQRQDYELALAAADAFSTAEKAAVDARRAELNVLRETGDLTRAQAAAQQTVNVAIAKANQDATDSLEIAKQNASYVGMTPYQRGRQQIVDKFEGYGGLLTKAAGENFDFKDNLTEAMKPVEQDFKTAGDQLAAAIREAAEKVKGAGPVAGGGLIPGSNAMLPSGGFTGGNAAYVLKALVANGYDPKASAGFVGGLMGESTPNLDPGAVNGSGHRGIAQWDTSRFNQAAMFNGTPLEQQTMLILKELASSESRAGSMLRGATTVQGGLDANLAFERPSKKEIADTYDKRLAYGNSVAGGGPLNIGSSASGVPKIASTAAGSVRAQEGVELGAYDKQQQIGPTTAAEQQIKQLDSALKAQTETYGQSAEKIARAAFEQNLYNQYQREGVTPTDETRKKIADLADQYEDVTKRTEELKMAQQRVSGAMDQVRSSADNAFGTFASDLAHGKSAGDAFKDVLSGIGQELISLGTHSLTSALFGGQGQSGGGLFGGGLQSLFGNLFSFGKGGGFDPLPHFATGTDSAPGGAALVGEEGPEIVNLPRGSEVIPHNQINNTREGSVIHRYGDVNIYPVGGAQFSDDQLKMIKQQVVQGQKESVKQVTRSFTAIQSDSQQYS